MTYRFPQFKATIENPSIDIVHVTDNLSEKTCSVDILLTTDSANFGINLTGFNYLDSWEDKDIENWVSLELHNYETK